MCVCVGGAAPALRCRDLARAQGVFFLRVGPARIPDHEFPRLREKAREEIVEKGPSLVNVLGRQVGGRQQTGAFSWAELVVLLSP